MSYISTRGEAPALEFDDALLTGLARDGGLYVPRAWPKLDRQAIAAMPGRSFAEVAADNLALFSGAPASDVLPLAQSTVSQHLKVLREAGIVRGTVEGPTACYCLDPEVIRWLANFCTDICCPPGGGGAACGPGPTEAADGPDATPLTVRMAAGRLR